MLKRLEMTQGELFASLLVLIVASVSPLAFTISAGTSYSLHFLATYFVLPAVILFILLIPVSRLYRWERLYRALKWSIISGLVGTLVMEVVRATGFRLFEGMPGSLPMLMGVLMTDRIMHGPNMFSNLIGWGDHFFNGISFAAIYYILIGRTRWWLGVIYALGIATVFMMSPVMNIIGAGYFGQSFSPLLFPLTVYLAHLVYGVVIGIIAERPHHVFSGIIPALVFPAGRLQAR